MAENMLYFQNNLCAIESILGFCLMAYSINANYNKLVDNIQAVHILLDFIHRWERSGKNLL